MKIMHVTKKYPNAMGGDAVVVYNLQQQQEAAGHKVVIVTSKCAEIRYAPNVHTFGLLDTPANLDKITLRRMVSLVFLTFAMFKLILKERPDVIHTHSIDMAFFVSLVAWLYDVPVMHTFHIVTFYDKSQSRFRRWSELWLARWAHLRVITAPNKYDVNQLFLKGLDQAQLLPNGVDTAFWNLEHSKPSTETTSFISVGRLETQKGYETLLRAMVCLQAATDRPFTVTIVGEGSRGEHLQDLAQELQIEDIVTFVGRKNAQEIKQMFAESDIAVFPSLYETTPLTLLEAWAARMPVISTSVGLLRDMPEDFNAAYVVAPKDENALAEAMYSAMHDTDKRDVIAENGHHEVQKYVWGNISRLAEFAYWRAYED